MTPIPSPYNFVPLSSNVFFPKWAPDVSMDVPFRNGISGWFEVEVTAHTPIYIRNGGVHDEDRQKRNTSADYLDFFKVQPNGAYAIPGSSFKGMLRNVVETISFGKMFRVDNRRYSIRDLAGPTSAAYRKKMTGDVKGERECYAPNSRAGWLMQDDEGNWSVQPCEHARIEQSHIPGGVLVDQRPSLVEKYSARLRQAGVRSDIQDVESTAWNTAMSLECWVQPTRTAHWHSRRKRLVYAAAFPTANRPVAPTTDEKIPPSQITTVKKTGTLVMTGQPGRQKHMEFLFFDSVAAPVPKPLQVIERVRRECEFVHTKKLKAEDEKKDPWCFWSKKLRQGWKVPVFYLPDSNGDVSALGFAQMFRLPYTYSVGQAIAHTSTLHGFGLDGVYKQYDPDRGEQYEADLAETIFGFVHGKQALRGRVQVYPLLSDTPPRTAVDIMKGALTATLMSPKPTYYPNYLVQNVSPTSAEGGIVGNYKTFMDVDCEVRGRKRYPVTPRAEELPTAAEATQDNMTTPFFPLPAGTKFKGRIHVHNLRPAELGAVLWALTWGGDESLRHSIGMAKPFGFGSISVTVPGLAGLTNMSGQSVQLAPEHFRKGFERLMRWKVESWKGTEQMKSLLAMANPAFQPPTDVRYPVLQEFVDHKDVRHSLLEYGCIRAVPAPNAAGKQNVGGQSKPAPALSVKVNSVVNCEVLEEKTKKGGWKLKIVNGSPSHVGVVHPQAVAKTPLDIATGKQYRMKIRVDSPGNMQFEWT